MKKVVLYSFLLAAMVFSGCSEKASQIDVVNNEVVESNNGSEDTLNNIPNANIEEVDMNTFELAGENEDGAYYIINGKKVFIENIYFAFNKYNLNSDMKEKAVSNASKLSVLKDDTTVKVTGNTDEWGTDEYNYALGLKRAKSVKDVLVSNGVTANITLVSYGESNPVCTEKTKSCWQKNRRVNHTLIK